MKLLSGPTSQGGFPYRLKIYPAGAANPKEFGGAPRQLVIDTGPEGSFDSGSVHGARIFKLKGRWYMVYEGWGSGRPGYDREKPYAPGGRSQTGLASVSVQAFLDWCGHD